MKDYYFVLGISKGADIQKIKTAYRRIVKKFHPDTRVESQSPDRFLEAQEAYDILSDESKRKEYDDKLSEEQRIYRIRRQLREKGVIPQSKQPPPIRDPFDDLITQVDHFFGGFVPTVTRQRQPQAKDLYVEIVLTPKEAVFGGIYSITIPVVQECSVCADPLIWERFYCRQCHGRGYVNSQKEISLAIPPRVSHDTQVALPLNDIGLNNTILHVSILIDPDASG